MPPKPNSITYGRRAATLVLSDLLINRRNRPVNHYALFPPGALIALPLVPVPNRDQRAIRHQRTEKSTFVYVNGDNMTLYRECVKNALE